MTEREPEATLTREHEVAASALSTVHLAARAKVCGLRVLIDAARLRSQQTGTEVATSALIEALARRSDVAQVCVALAGELPAYATALARHPKIDARITPRRDFSVFGRVDVAHRPFQPDSPADMEACRAAGDRTAITILDLIAYHAVSYQPAPEYWTTYREWLRRAIAEADAVVAPSHDVRRQILLERLPVDPERVLVAELGTDHLTGDEPEARPPALPPDCEFVVVLGADYTHKNRDLAIRAHRELRRRGFDEALVLTGMRVYGSSRELEEAVTAPEQQVIVLPDVSSAERNWLLRHASVVLYPTSAEGFGFVPFEAARLGTPTAFVPFGPLVELAGDLPVHALDWSPASLADAVARLLGDAGLARAQVATTLAASERHTWDAAAEKLAGVYRSLLARPAVPRQSAAAAPGPGDAAEQLQQLRREHDALREEHERVRLSPAYALARRAGDLGRALRGIRHREP